MKAWTSEELDKIAAADELRIAPSRPDGTLRNPVVIWVVRHGDGLYVRSYRGHDAAWYRAAQDRHEGHVSGGGVDKEVTFADVNDDAINDEIDAAYQNKYRRYGPRFVDPMVGPRARATTLKLLPRS